MKRFASSLVALGLTSALGIQPVLAQVSAGGGASGDVIALYEIRPVSGNMNVLGTVIVVPSLANINTDPILLPKDFELGSELWHWDTPSQAYPGAFMLVPSSRTEIPSDKLSDYDVFDHDAFDLSDPHPMPKVYVDGDDATFAVYDYDFKGKTFSDTLAWFDFQDGGQGDQLAFSDKELGQEYLSIAKNHALVFVADALPAQGSIEIVEAR